MRTPLRASGEGGQLGRESKIDWEQVRQDFGWDGSWRDIYVLDTTAADWQRLIDRLRALNPPPEFLSDGDAWHAPVDVSASFAKRELASAMMTVTWRGLQLNCHFFCEEQIEFDFDPREVTGSEKFAALLGFFELVGSIVCKPVVMTPENAPEYPFLRYEPLTGTTHYVP